MSAALSASVLLEVLTRAEEWHGQPQRRGGSKITFPGVLAACRETLVQHGLDPSRDIGYLRFFLRLNLDPEPDWWVKFDAAIRARGKGAAAVSLNESKVCRGATGEQSHETRSCPKAQSERRPQPESRFQQPEREQPIAQVTLPQPTPRPTPIVAKPIPKPNIQPLPPKYEPPTLFCPHMAVATRYWEARASARAVVTWRRHVASMRYQRVSDRVRLGCLVRRFTLRRTLTRLRAHTLVCRNARRVAATVEINTMAKVLAGWARATSRQSAIFTAKVKICQARRARTALACALSAWRRASVRVSRARAFRAAWLSTNALSMWRRALRARYVADIRKTTADSMAQRHALSRAIRVLRMRVLERKISHLLRRKAQTHWAWSRARTAVGTWRRAARSSALKNALIATTQSRTRRRLAFSVFRAWRSARAVRVASRKIKFSSASARTRQAIRAWRVAASARVLRRGLRCRATSYAQALAKHSAIAKWKQMWLRGRLVRARNAWLRRANARRVLTAWARTAMVSKRGSDVALARATRAQARAFVTWRWCLSARRAQAAVAISRWRQRRAARACFAWRLITQRMRTLKSVLISREFAGTVARVRDAMRRLQSHMIRRRRVESTAIDMAREACRRSRVRGAWKAWVAAISASRARHAAGAKVRAISTISVASHAMSTWRRALALRRRTRTACRQLASWTRHRTQRVAIQRLRRNAIGRHDQDRIACRAAHARRLRLAAAALETWRAHLFRRLKSRHQTAAVAAVRARAVLEHAWYAWGCARNARAKRMEATRRRARHVIGLWRAIAAKRLAKRRQISRVGDTISAVIRGRVKARVVVAWVRAARRTRVIRRHIHRAAGLVALRVWRGATARARHTCRCEAAVASLSRARRLRHALLALRAAGRDGVTRRQIAMSARREWRQLSLQRAINKWLFARDWARWRRRAMALAADRRTRSLKARVWAEWRCARDASARGRALARTLHRCAARRWLRSLAAKAILVVSRGRAAEAASRRARTADAFKRWRTGAMAQASAQAWRRGAGRRALLRHVWTRWKWSFSRSNRRRWFQGRRHALTVLSAWRKARARSASIRHARAAVIRVHAQSTMSQTLTAWRTAAKDRRLRRALVVATSASQSARMAGVFRAWHRARIFAVSRRVAVSVRPNRLIRSSFDLWTRAAAPVRRAALANTLRVTRQALKAWQWRLAKRRAFVASAELVQARLAAHQVPLNALKRAAASALKPRRKILLDAMRTWRDCAKAARVEQAHAGLAVVVWARSASRRGLRQWYSVVERRKRLEQAYSACLGVRASKLAGKALAVWALRLVARQGRRNVMRSADALCARHIASYFWTLWREGLQSKRRYRPLAAATRGVRALALGRRVLSAWRERAGRVRVNRRALARTMRRLRCLYIRDVFMAWAAVAASGAAQRDEERLFRYFSAWRLAAKRTRAQRRRWTDLAAMLQ